MNRLLGLSWILIIPIVVNGQQVFLQATREGQRSMRAQQAALAKLSLRIAANVEIQINVYQILRNKKFNQIASQRLSFTSKRPLLGSTIEITEKGGLQVETSPKTTSKTTHERC